MRMRTCALAALALAASPVLGAGVSNTLYLNHFDSPIGSGAGSADYANGDPTEQIGTPNGPGGTVSATNPKFGPAALDRTTGGRVEYATSGNWNPQVGTIEMWVRGNGVTNSDFEGLWGTDTGTGNGADYRMYIYNTGAGRTLGAYMLGGNGASFWECEQAIPANLLDNSNWHNVVWEYDTGSGQTATFWDGHLLRNTPDAGTVNDHGATNTLFHIGENQQGSAAWSGSIDEFRISDVMRYSTSSDFTPATAPFVVPEPAALGMLLVSAAGLMRRRAVR